MKKKQSSFDGFPKEQRAFAPGKRTTRAARQRRPRATKEAMHLVLRSDVARGTKSLLKYDGVVRAVIAKLAQKHGVRIYRIVNAGNHLHITLKLSKQFLWKGFISGITGGIARAVGFKRVPNSKVGFWNSRPFTRLIAWGRDYNIVKDYHTLNQLEADGAVPPRSQMLRPERWRHVVRALS
ncbi:MAG: transposase [Bdellovibrionaceae bacterium]|nr:transposase [Pseudobdellovibrionaceae bacterium]